MDLLNWLKVHRLGYIHASKYEMSFDYGYIKACDVIEAEMERIIEEHRDESDRLAGDKGLLE
jgi:hypothetical protein